MLVTTTIPNTTDVARFGPSGSNLITDFVATERRPISGMTLSRDRSPEAGKGSFYSLSAPVIDHPLHKMNVGTIGDYQMGATKYFG